MTLKILLMLSAVFLFSACACKPKIITEIKEVNIPVKCGHPKVTCIMPKGNPALIMQSLLVCVADLRASIRVCDK